MALGRLLLVIYYFTAGDSQRRIAIYLGLNPNLVSSICRRLQDVCSRDLQNRPITPFGGPGTVSKCDESKFNHKPKVTPCNYTINSNVPCYVANTKKKKCEEMKSSSLSETPCCFILHSLCITVHRKKTHSTRILHLTYTKYKFYCDYTPTKTAKRKKTKKTMFLSYTISPCDYTTCPQCYPHYSQLSDRVDHILNPLRLTNL